MENIDLVASKLVEIAESQLSSSYVWHNRILWKVANIKIPFSDVFPLHLTDFYGDSEYTRVHYLVQSHVHERELKSYKHDIHAIIKAAKKLRPAWTIEQCASRVGVGGYYDTFSITVRQLK